MRNLIVSKRFERNLGDFLGKHPDLKSVVRNKLDILRKNPRDLRLKTHKLTGKLKSCFALSITYDYQLVFHFDKTSIFPLAIGTHDEVY